MSGMEITENQQIMNEFGKPLQFGWAKEPYFEYNLPVINSAFRTRVTEADRYIVFTHTHIIVFEIIDGGYLGHIGISIYSIKDHRWSSRSLDSFFSMGNFGMPRTIETGSIKVREKHLALDFVVMESSARIIKVDFPRFSPNRHLRGQLVLLKPFPDLQSIAAVSPWRRDKRAFRYTCCSPWYITEGVLQFGSTEIFFTRDKAWGIHDWKREVRHRWDIRYWASACGIADGRLVGFSIGYDSADSSNGTENAFFLDGLVHKLDQVTFHIPPSNWLDPWKFTSNDNRLEMAFLPFEEQKEYRRFVFHSVKCRQVCGTFSGRVILDDGSSIAFWNITGFAERRRTRF